jgi:hypothetical protein
LWAQTASIGFVDVLGLIGSCGALVQQLDDRYSLANRLLGLLALVDLGNRTDRAVVLPDWTLFVRRKLRLEFVQSGEEGRLRQMCVLFATFPRFRHSTISLAPWSSQ